MRFDPLRLVIITAITAAIGVKALFWLSESRPPAESLQSDLAAAPPAASPQGTGSIAGTVFDQHGRGANGRSVRLMRVHPPDGPQLAHDRRAMVRTGGNGSYRFDHLEAGSYVVVAALNTSATERVFHPDASRIAGAATIAIASGEKRDGIDLRYREAPKGIVEGTITRPDGEPVRITVNLIPSGAPQPELLRLTTGTDENGRFSFTGVPAEDYWIVAHTQVRGIVPSDTPVLERPLVAIDIAPVQASATTTRKLVARPAMNVSIELAFDRSSQATVPDNQDRTHLLRLTGRDHLTRTLLALIDTPVRATGETGVTVHGVPAGRYGLLTNPGSFWRVDSARGGTEPEPTRTFEVTEGTDLTGIRIAFTARPAGGGN